MKIMKLVREYIEFVRGEKPKDSMHIGKRALIEKWLAKMNIKKYEILEDDYVNVKQTVDITNLGLKELPEHVNFNTISGGFYAGNNKFKFLDGMPLIVSGSFIIDNNQLKSLVGGPKIVSGNYVANNNKLTSIKGLPEKIYTLAINDNMLTSLKGCPNEINGDFFCDGNELDNLDYLPEKIEGSLFISYTKEFKEKYKNDASHKIGHFFIEEIRSKSNISGNIKII